MRVRGTIVLVNEPARHAVLSHFGWQDGHADIWKLFSDAVVFNLLISGLVAPWRDAEVTHVVAVESRGFLLGGAVARELEAGFVAVRKRDGLLPGPKVEVTAASEDYRGQRQHLRMQRTLHPGDRVLLVDDWAERGSQAQAAAHLIRQCHANFLGLTVVVNQLDPSTEAQLERVTAIVRAEELGPPGGASGRANELGSS